MDIVKLKDIWPSEFFKEVWKEAHLWQKDPTPECLLAIAIGKIKKEINEKTEGVPKGTYKEIEGRMYFITPDGKIYKVVP